MLLHSPISKLILQLSVTNLKIIQIYEKTKHRGMVVQNRS